jgi:hypothetical protein
MFEANKESRCQARVHNSYCQKDIKKHVERTFSVDVHQVTKLLLIILFLGLEFPSLGFLLVILVNLSLHAWSAKDQIAFTFPRLLILFLFQKLLSVSYFIKFFRLLMSHFYYLTGNDLLSWEELRASVWSSNFRHNLILGLVTRFHLLVPEGKGIVLFTFSTTSTLTTRHDFFFKKV